jgi:mxaJ protein
MSSRCLSKIAVILALLFCAHPASAAQPFRICAEPDNLPMSQQSSGSGFEIEVARLLAKDMGEDLDIKWVSQRDHSYFRQTIGAGQCDAIMGIPAGFAKLTTTKPWYRTGFVFVTRQDAKIPVLSFDDVLLKTLSIGVPATGLGETPPAIALTKRGLAGHLRPYSIYEPQKMIEAVAEKNIDMAILWGPFAGWFSGQQNIPLTFALTPDKDGDIPFVFDISIGVRKGNDALRDRLNLALDHQQAEIAVILNRWHVPQRKD